MPKRRRSLSPTLPSGSAKVLAENVRRLIDYHEASENRIAQIKRFSQTTLNRITHGQGAARLSSVEALAKAFGLDAWQLLVPDLDPRNPPTLDSVLKASEALEALYEARAALDRVTPPNKR